MNRSLTNLLRGVVIGAAATLAVATTCFADYKTDLNAGKGFFSVGRAAEKKGDNETAEEKYREALGYFKQAQKQKPGNESLVVFIAKLEAYIKKEKLKITELEKKTKTAELKDTELKQTPKAIQLSTKANYPYFVELSVIADYFIPSSVNRTVKDVSPELTVDSRDILKTDKYSLEGKVNLGNFDLEVKRTGQGGTLERNSTIFDIIDIFEDGDYSHSQNIAKVLFDFEYAGFGIGYFSENEKKEYTQRVLGAENKIKTEEQMTAFGFVLRVLFTYQTAVDIKLSSDIFHSFVGDGKRHLEFEDTTLPGDSKYDRERKANVLDAEAKLEITKRIRKLNSRAVGLATILRYTSKKIKQESTTEKYMPVYENYKDTSLKYTIELFARLKYLKLRAGFEKEQHKSTGTLKIDKDNPTRIYAGSELNLEF